MNFSRVSLAFLCRQLAPYPFPASGNRTHICQAHSNWTRGRPNAVPEYILIYQLFLHSKHESIALPLFLSLSRNSPGVIGVIRIKSNNSKRFNPFDPTHSRISGAPNETCEGLLKNCLWKQNIFRAINHRHCTARGGTVLCASLSLSLTVYPFSLLLFMMMMMMTISMAQWQLGAIRFSCGEERESACGGKSVKCLPISAACWGSALFLLALLIG